MFKDRVRKNIEEAAFVVLRELQIPFTRYFVKEFLSTHPDYPSLYALKDLFGALKIETMAVKIDPQKLLEVKGPAVISLDIKEGKDRGIRYVVLTEVNSRTIKYIDPLNGLIEENMIAFSRKWTRVVLLLAKTEQSEEENFKENKIKQNRLTKTTGIVVSLVLSILVAVVVGKIYTYDSFFGNWLIVFLFNLGGLGASILVLLKQLGWNTPALEKLCSSQGNVNCDEVLQSGASKVFSWLSWGEVGVFYFAGTLLFIAYADLSMWHDVERLLLWIGLPVLPVSVGLIFYQFKTWKFCSICMTVHAVLWSEVIYLYVTLGAVSFPANSEMILFFLLSVMLPVLFWLVLREKVEAGTQSILLKKKLALFNSSPLVYRSILEGIEPIHQDPLPDDIVTGKLSSPISIIAMLSGHCKPCYEIFENLMKIGETVDVKITIRFAAGDAVKRQFAQYAAAYKMEHDDERAIEMLRFWYESEKEFDLLKQKFPLSGNIDQDKIRGVVDAWNAWAVSVKISATPTLVINGRLKPSGLSILDFRPYFQWRVKQAEVH